MKVVELIDAEVADAIPHGSDAYLPTDNWMAAIYEAALDAATMPDHTPRFDIHGGEVAQATGIGKTAVRGNLFRLQERGYVKHQQGRHAIDQHREIYRIKPQCANLKLWCYSEVRDPGAVSQFEVKMR